jgi:hypothetical protein
LQFFEKLSKNRWKTAKKKVFRIFGTLFGSKSVFFARVEKNTPDVQAEGSNLGQKPPLFYTFFARNDSGKIKEICEILRGEGIGSPGGFVRHQHENLTPFFAHVCVGISTLFWGTRLGGAPLFCPNP